MSLTKGMEKQMIKKVLWAIVVLFAALNPLSAKEKVFHAETRYFDIIFDEKSKSSAEEIFNCADDLLLELCSQYKVEPDFRIPVVVTSKTENFNAYFTNFNYNHIVVYDTVPDEDFIEFSNNTKSVFLHELTHLVSTNARNGFWRTAGKYFGDTYNPGFYLVMPSFFKEGATVNQESQTGQGRLNDGFFLHNIKQAKISGKFPGYTDSFGARTIYPSGTSAYLFGGAFTEYIIEKYGMDKYAEFWHAGTNGRKLTSTAVFKKVYGVSMKKEWKNFYDSIDTSDIEKNPENIEGIKKSGFNNKSLHRYSVLGIKNNESVILDETTCQVFIGGKKLWTKTALNYASLSQNGKYIVTTIIDTNHFDEKIKAEIYDIENNKWIDPNLPGTKLLTVFENNGKEFIACINSVSQKCILEIRSFDKNFSLVSSFEFPENQMPYGLTADGSGNIYFILKNSFDFYLCRAKFNLNESAGSREKQIQIQSFSLGNMKPRFLSVYTDKDKTTATFSYTESKCFPRLAMAELSENEIKLFKLEKDFSGGIYSPVLNPASDKKEIIYSAKFYDECALYSLDLNSFEKEISVLQIKETEIPDDKNLKTPAKENVAFNYSEYKKLFYTGKTIVPISVLKSYYISPSVYFDDEKDCLGNGSSYLPGFTITKSNPQDTKFMALTAGFNSSKNAGGAGLIFMGKSSGGNFRFTNTVNSIFDKDGFMQANNSLETSIKFATGNISKVIFSESNFLLYGKDDMKNKTRNKYFLSDEQLEKNYFYCKNILSASYSTIHKTGERSHELSGFKFGMNLKNVYATTDAKKEDSIFYAMRHYKNDRLSFSQVYPDLEISIPKIIPIDCKGPFTYNLPVKAYGSLFQFNDTFATLAAESVLFSWEVQRGMGSVPLYVSTLSLNANYQDSYETGLNRNMEIRYLKEDFENVNDMVKNRYAGGSLVFKVGGNSGALANSDMNVSVTCKVLYGLEGEHKNETKFLLTSALNFALF